MRDYVEIANEFLRSCSDWWGWSPPKEKDGKKEKEWRLYKKIVFVPLFMKEGYFCKDNIKAGVFPGNEGGLFFPCMRMTYYMLSHQQVVDLTIASFLKDKISRGNEIVDIKFLPHFKECNPKDREGRDDDTICVVFLKESNPDTLGEFLAFTDILDNNAGSVSSESKSVFDEVCNFLKS